MAADGGIGLLTGIPPELAFRGWLPEPFGPLPEADPMVSVVLRTRDRSLLLGRALASIAGRTLPAWEVVVANDGGPAEAVEAVVDAAIPPALRHRVRLLHAPVSAGRWVEACAAFAAGTAPLVALLDDDDTWEPEFLAAGVARLRQADAARLAGVVTRWSQVFEEIAPDGGVHRQSVMETGPRFDTIGFEELLAPANFQPQALLMRREAALRAGGWDPALRIAGDWEFHLRLLAEGELAVVPRALANWHRRLGIPAGSSALANVSTGWDDYIAFHAAHRTGLVRGALRQAPWLAAPLLLAGAEATARGQSHAALAHDHVLLNGRLAALEGTAAALLGRDDPAPRLAILQDVPARLAAMQDVPAGLAALEDVPARLAALESAFHRIEAMIGLLPPRFTKVAQAAERLEQRLADQAPVLRVLEGALRAWK